jgi:hypothetical protein
VGLGTAVELCSMPTHAIRPHEWGTRENVSEVTTKIRAEKQIPFGDDNQKGTGDGVGFRR